MVFKKDQWETGKTGNGMNSVAKQPAAADGGQLRKSKETNPPLSSIVSNTSPFCELVALSGPPCSQHSVCHLDGVDKGHLLTG